MHKTVFPTVTLEKLEVVKSFTNGFAQKVLFLEDGRIIRVSFNDDEVQIVTPAQEA